uniref:Protein phosphatase 1 regulatory subunit 37 n=2 Tax=Oryzias sinensis TaxID=183150 RepID=A0A8C7XHQ8_9TELE
MNIQEQCLDLCNVKTKSNVDNDFNPTSITEGVTLISELMTDSEAEKPNIVPTEASETCRMPQLTDNLQGAEEDNQKAQDTLEIDEVNGNRKNCVQDTPAVVNVTGLIFPNDGQYKDDTEKEKMKDDKCCKPESPVVEVGDDGGDMDIGVDLTLGESELLQAESADLSSLSDAFLDLESTLQDFPADETAESQSDAKQTESSSSDQARLCLSNEDGDGKHKPSGKRVTFPSDEDIVSGAVEPKDPWRHAQNVTVEEILTCYKQACQKLNCKPIPKVLKQIQELKDLTLRNECLDLKGEKLDYKACESLEEILKRVQFKTVDLEQTNLDEDGASALFDMIEYYESATHLNISFNKHIGTRGWQAAAHMMRKTSSLQYLDARNTPLLDHSAPFVARALRISGSLAVLHLENAGLSGRPLMLLATALKMNMNLRELYLADNKLNGLQDSAQLGNLLKFNYNIQILDLRNNHILDSGLAYLCEGLKEQRKGLVTLVLWNNQLTHSGMGYLAAALPCTQSLETLNLGHNSVSNEGVHKLKDGLIANRSVLRLGLASTKLSCEGAVAVAEFIAESPRLLRLDLRENEIKTGGLMALSLALKVNTSLLRLDLDREPKKETVKSFIETQRALLAEIQNGCKRNFILAKEKEELDQKMRLSTSMAEIATEDGTREEEEEELPSSDEREQRNKEAEISGNEGQASSQAEGSTEKNVPAPNLESDSDTEDEDDGEEVTKSSSAPNSTAQSQTAPQSNSGAAKFPPSASSTSSHPAVSPAAGQRVISGITVTEATVPTGTPPSPGRCISVSSPGRGHKIFMVTRVESPPEPQQKNDPTAPILTKAASEKAAGVPSCATQQTPPPASTPTSEQTQLTGEEVNQGSAAASALCTKQSTSESNTTLTSKLESQPASRPTEDGTARTLGPSLQTRALPSDSASVQSATSQLAEGGAGTSVTPQPDDAKEEESHAQDLSKMEEMNQPQDLQQQQQLLSSALLNDQASEETSPSNQADQGPPQQEEMQEAPAHSPTQNEESWPKPAEAAEQEGEPEASVPHKEAQNLHLTSTPSEGSPVSVVERGKCVNEVAADEGFADALDENVASSALPNGLKPEFAVHLLSSESPKPGNCVMEHAASADGEQELEELLREASLESGRDAV